MNRNYNSKVNAGINKYFRWLVRKVRVSITSEPDMSYYLLMKELFKKEFYWSIEFDENRSADGLYLREQYFEDPSEFDLGPCRVLEMLVALAMRCENILTDLESDRTGVWFWDMIENLGLDMYYDSNFDADEVDYIVTKWLDRDYDSDGRGNIFYINHHQKSEIPPINYLEIWLQMQIYVSKMQENDEKFEN